MAVTRAGLPLWELNRKDQRYLNWLWVKLDSEGILRKKSHQPLGYDRFESNSIDIQNHCRNQNIEREVFLKQKIKDSKDHMLNEKSFEWIRESDTRLAIWVLHKLNEQNNTFIPLGPKQNKERILQLKCIFDLWEVSLQQKNLLLEEMQIEWYQISKNKKQWNWLNKSDHLQCSYVWDYLCGKKYALQYLAPCDSEETYYAIIASFDVMTPSITEEHKAHIFTSIKNAWYRKRYRNNLDNKKAYSFVMGIKIQDKLNELSANLDADKNAIVERLINEEFNKLEKSKNI